MMSKPRTRLDSALLDRGMLKSRQYAQSLILAGKVVVNNRRINKPGSRVSPDDRILVNENRNPYVSRGGLKLESALKTLDIDVNGLTCLDVGASTGGFTDCLLQHGARCVFAVDVGYGQLAWKLRQDSRVTVIERTNIRLMPMEVIPQPIDLITIDVSFISLKIVVPAVIKFLKKGGHILALIKPQFEVGKGKVGKGGVVRDPALHEAVLSDMTEFFHKNDFSCSPVVPSPILGPKGNREFMIYLTEMSEN